MNELPEDIRSRFVAAGWYSGRQVPISSVVPADHPAAWILAAFAGLTIIPAEEGEECGPNELAFQELTLDKSVTHVWAGLLKTCLIGIADAHYGHSELYIASDERCFCRSNVHDAFYFQAASFAEAVERSLLGRRARPMLRPDQPSVTLYGKEFTSDSPEVYRYE